VSLLTPDTRFQSLCAGIFHVGWEWLSEANQSRAALITVLPTSQSLSLLFISRSPAVFRVL